MKRRADVLTKVDPKDVRSGDDRLPTVVDQRAVLPYDPKVTLKKTLTEAALSAGVLMATALGAWLLDVENIKFLLNTLGVGGTLVTFAAVPVLHGLVKGALNYLKTKNGVWFERREDVRQGAEGPSRKAVTADHGDYCPACGSTLKSIYGSDDPARAPSGGCRDVWHRR